MKPTWCTIYSQCSWVVQKVSDVIFFRGTNQTWEVFCGREVEGTFMRIRGFFSASRQCQSHAASVWVTVSTQRALHS